MQFALRLVSYVFHPLFIPIIGTILYFSLAPYSPLEQQSGTILPIFILTVIIPIIFFFILKNLKLISINSQTTKERIYPILISCGLYIMILYKIIPQNYINEIHYFFIGLLTSLIALLILLLLNYKASIHLTGMGSILIFLIGLSIHFKVNIIIPISILTFVSGLVASSRLYQKIHSISEIILGLLIGIFSQLFLFKFWL